MAWKKILLEGDAAELSDTAPVNVIKQTAAAGSAATASRQDHAHDVTVAVPGNITEGDTAAEGIAASLARSDHKHGSPATWAPTSHALSGHSAAVATMDFGQQQVQRAVIHPVATPPDAAAEVEGQIYFDTTVGDKHAYIWVA